LKIYQRAVRFEEVDAAGIVYFPKIVSYAHEAMEDFFDSIEGGYPGLIMERRLGLPAVKLESEFSAPLRYGDEFRIETSVAELGGRSVVFRFRILRVSNDQLCATLHHTVVMSDLRALKSVDMPADVRTLLEHHRS
jgi:4-hydroxybenzoyl-CoA thioesterase